MVNNEVHGIVKEVCALAHTHEEENKDDECMIATTDNLKYEVSVFK